MPNSLAPRALRLGLALCIALAAAGSPGTPPAAAAPASPPLTLLVDREDDLALPAATACTDVTDNDCSLRGAVTRANETSGAIVQLEWNKTYTVSIGTTGNGLITAYTDMTIQPGGTCGQIVCATVIRAIPAWNYGLLGVGITATVVISGVILTESGSSNGGALYNAGVLTVTNSLVLSNTVEGWGGGIYNTGSLYLYNTYVTRNRARITGGGIANEGGSVSLFNSTVMSNTTFGTNPSDGTGAQITNDNSFQDASIGRLLVSNSYILSNTTLTQSVGGGLYNDGLATIISSTISGNFARDGGGLDNNRPITGQITVTASLIMSNTSFVGDAGLRNDGRMLITGSTLRGNTSPTGSGAIGTNGQLTLVDSTIVNNSGTDGGGILTGSPTAQVWLDNTAVLSNTALYGGGLAGFGAYTLTNGSLINNNTAFQGGEVNLNSTGRLEAQAGTHINGNTATGFCLGCARGGGIDNAGLVLLTGVQLLNNLSPNGPGGALRNAAGATALLTDTLVGLNSASDGGGGLANAGALTVTTSAIYSNTTPAAGGGLSNTGALRLLNTTLSGNQAGYGGGVWSSGVVSQSFTTIALNTAVTGTGGIQTTGVYTTGSSLVSRNVGPNADCTGPVTSRGYNLVGDTTGCTLTGGPNDQLDLDALLLPLSLVSGTWVVDLQVDSPALDAADQAACPPTDQAHTARPLGFGCDIGAYKSANFTIFYLFLPLALRGP